MKYYQNGTLRFTSATAPVFPLLVDTTIELVGTCATCNSSGSKSFS